MTEPKLCFPRPYAEADVMRMVFPKSPLLISLSLLPLFVMQSATPQASAEEESFAHLLDQVVVVKIADSKIEVPGKKSQPAKLGQAFRISQIKDHWLWVNQAGGWLNANAVVLQNQAEQFFTNRLKEQPTAQHFYARGMMWSGQQEYGRAIIDFEAALRLDPLLSLAHVGRGNCLFVRKFHDRAIEAYTEAIETDQKLAIAYANRGNAWQALGKFQSALSDYAIAAELAPDSAIVYNNRGNCFFAMGNVEKAMADYSAAIHANSRFADAFNNRGYLAYTEGNYDEALADFQKAADYDPDSPRAFNNAAWIRAACPDRRFLDANRAIVAAERAVSLSDRSRSWHCHGTLAAAYAQDGQFDKAVDSQLHAIATMPRGISVRERVEQLRRLDLYLSKKPYEFPRPATSVANISSLIPPQS